MGLFWRYGYEATSLADLLREMGIGRQSLYNTFGSKHSLFVEAVQHYNSKITRRLINILSAPGSGLHNIRQALELSASLASSKDYCGCFITNSMIEVAPHDNEVAKIIRSTNQQITDAFEEALERAIEAGEILEVSHARAKARFLNAAMHAIVVSGKASLGKAVISDIVKITLTKL